MLEQSVPLQALKYGYHKALTGKRLDRELTEVAADRPALIENILYERSILLVSADPGVGKSTIIANILAQGSSGLPVFSAFHVPKPLTCYYIPFERGAEEIKERLKHMRESIPVTYDNIHIFDNAECPVLNLLDTRDQDFLMYSIESDCINGVDLVVYDPIYASVAGGLSNEDKVSAFTRFNTRLVANFGCATWLNHHTVKPQFTKDGDTIERDDPFYGSQFLKAHATGSFYLKKRPAGEDGCKLIRKKDNWSVMLPVITLEYNPEDYTSTAVNLNLELPVHDKLVTLYRTLKKSGKSVTFKEILGCMPGVCESTLREHFRHPFWTPLFKKHKSNGRATLYEPIGEI